MPEETLEVLIRMRGRRVFSAEARTATADVERLRAATDRQGASAGRASRLSSGLAGSWNSMTHRGGALLGLFGGLAARAAQGAAAMGGLTAAGTLWMGLSFDARMEQYRVAFTTFLGSTQAADKYLRQLYQLAATTPFEFPQITQAAQRLIAYGASAQEATGELRVLADAASGLGTGSEGIDRMVIALGQMRAAGVVQGDELRQFQEAGVNVYKYMEAAGLITKADIGQIGNMHIDAAKAIDAIMKGMNRDFGGMSAQQAKTWTGQLSTIKDYAGQAAGALVQPLFDFARSNILPRISRLMQGIAQWARGGGLQQAFGQLRAGFQGGPSPQQAAARKGAARAEGATAVAPPQQMTAMQTIGQDAAQVWQRIVIPAFEQARAVVLQLFDAFRPAMPFVQNVVIPLLQGLAIGVLGGVVFAFKAAIVVIRIVAVALGWIGQRLAFASGFFRALGVVIGFVFGGAILDFLRGLSYVGRAAGLLSGPLRLMDSIFGAIGRAISTVFRWALRVGSALSGPLVRGIQMVFSPIGLLRTAFGALRRTGGDAVAWIQLRWEALVGFFRRMPGRLSSIFSGLWRGLVSAFKAALNLIIGAWNGLEFGLGPVTLKIPGPLPDVHIPRIAIGTPNIPLLQEGGVASGPGSFIAGEAGAEVVTLGEGQGARVEPLDRGQQPIQLMLPNGRVLFEWLVGEASSVAAR